MRLYSVLLFCILLFVIVMVSCKSKPSSETSGPTTVAINSDGSGNTSNRSVTLPTDVDNSVDSESLSTPSPAVEGVSERADVVVTPDSISIDIEPAPPTCDTPTAFVLPEKPSGFDHTETELLTITQGSANHRGQDVVVKVGQPQVLIAKFAYGLFDKDLKDEWVEIFIQDPVTCGPWVSLGKQKTSQGEGSTTKFGIKDDGGRIFFEIPPQLARPTGWHRVRIVVQGDHSMAAFSLVVLPEETDAVVFDIDGTLTTADFELMKQLFFDLLSGDYVPEMYPSAVDVVTAWAKKGYLVIYLTGRPDMLKASSQKWLTNQGFPPGPVHLTDSNRQALPTTDFVGQYKAEFLVSLQNNAGIRWASAYGNASTDIDAYEKAGIDKTKTYIIGKNAGKQNTIALSSYTDHLPVALSSPEAEHPAPDGAMWE